MTDLKKTFVGFGFGPIQSALFLFEAFMSGNFSRYVVAEIDAELVKAVRDNGGSYTLNIARQGRTDQVTVRGVELYNPKVAEDRVKVIAAIAQADEMATALPSVNFFDSGNEASVVQMLAEGLKQRSGAKPAVIYAAENHNHAAEILLENLQKYAPADAMKNVQVVNTVIGKMSGVIGEAEVIAQLKLAPMTPQTPKAILVEEFNRILISRITRPGFARGIDVFVEKDDLLPFEEAKLYGHNAVHALIGYLSDLRGLTAMSQAADHPDIMQTARRAFLEETGPALIQKYGSLNDPMFTAEGYRAYAEDLLERMVRPNLNDLVSRVTRDPVRKLSYDDRLYGTMRLALQHGIQPAHMARGAAAAILMLVQQPQSLKTPLAALPKNASALTEPATRQLLRTIWADKTDEHADALVRLTWQAIESLRRS